MVMLTENEIEANARSIESWRSFMVGEIDRFIEYYKSMRKQALAAATQREKDDPAAAPKDDYQSSIHDPEGWPESMETDEWIENFLVWFEGGDCNAG